MAVPKGGKMKKMKRRPRFAERTDISPKQLDLTGNPRVHKPTIERLARNIANVGLLVPPLVCVCGDEQIEVDGEPMQKYGIIDGYTRTEACVMLMNGEIEDSEYHNDFRVQVAVGIDFYDLSELNKMVLRVCANEHRKAFDIIVLGDELGKIAEEIITSEGYGDEIKWDEIPRNSDAYRRMLDTIEEHTQLSPRKIRNALKVASKVGRVEPAVKKKIEDNVGAGIVKEATLPMICSFDDGLVDPITDAVIELARDEKLKNPSIRAGLEEARRQRTAEEIPVDANVVIKVIKERARILDQYQTLAFKVPKQLASAVKKDAKAKGLTLSKWGEAEFPKIVEKVK